MQHASIAIRCVTTVPSQHLKSALKYVFGPQHGFKHASGIPNIVTQIIHTHV